MAKRKSDGKKYFPLLYIDHYEQSGNMDVVSMLAGHGLVPADTGTEEFAEFIFSDSFLDPAYQGRFGKLNRYMMTPGFAENVRKDIPDQIWKGSGIRGVITELRDVYGIPAVLTLWSRHKQSYRLDGDFFDELRATEGLAVPRGAFLHLPVPTMYMDLSMCRGIEPFVGAFVHAYDTGNGGQIVMFMLTKDEVSFSCYSGLEYGENGIAEVRGPLVPDSDFMAIGAPMQDEPVVRQMDDEDHRTEIVRSIIQALLFLSMEKPDVQENADTARTYRPTTRPRNRWSEVQMWDVGTRYGSAIRRALNTQGIASKQGAAGSGRGEAAAGPASVSAEAAAGTTAGAPKRPHVRRAHWQRYHVGKGRKEIRVNWIPPVFVNGDAGLPVAIHETGAASCQSARQDSADEKGGPC